LIYLLVWIRRSFILQFSSCEVYKYLKGQSSILPLIQAFKLADYFLQIG
jgi:hypothetical protein